jgi:hypothetical protein
MNKAQELIKKYDLKPNSYYTESPYKNKELLSSLYSDEMMNDNWKDHIPDGWYGWDIGGFLPDRCMEAINEFLEWVNLLDPAFEIHQLKIKYGGFRCNIQTELNISDQITLLESYISDDLLFW